MAPSNTHPVSPQHLQKSFTYPTYRQQLEGLLAENKTTGPNQSAEMVHFGRLNFQRMNRLDKTIQLLPDWKGTLADLEENWIWLVLTEGWCGDAAQAIPLLAKIEALSPHISLRLLLRDENPELMDAFLTGGSRSIPKLIAMREKDLELLGTWGPRPKPLTAKIAAYRQEGRMYLDYQEDVQKWYLSDKTISTQHELLQLVESWKRGNTFAGN